MNAEPMIANPLGWAQVKLLGGGRRLLTIAGGYAGVVLLVHVLFYRGVGGGNILPATFAGGAQTVMILVMGVIIVFGGAGAIKKAIHRDFTTDMITSHRVTAMTGPAAVIGYLTGATAQVFVLTGVNVLACTVLAVIAGNPVYVPSVLLVVLGCLTLMCWTFAVLLALSTRGASSAVGVVVLLLILARTPAIGFLPGLSLVVGATTISSLSSAASTGVADASVFVSMFAQVALALTFFLAAARKFARDDVQAFNPVLAYALLALCALTAAAALRFWRTPGVAFVAPVFTDLRLQSITTVTALALVAFLPVASTAKSAARWAARKAKDPGFTKPAPRAFLAAPVVATCLVFGIFAAVLAPRLPEKAAPTGMSPRAAGPSQTSPAATGTVQTPPPPAAAALMPMPAGSPAPTLMRIVRAADRKDMLRRIGWIAAFFFLALVTVAGLLRFTYARSDKGLWILVGYVVLVWAMPPFADLAIEVTYGRAPEAGASALLACSPVGAWIAAFGDMAAPLIPGLAFQVFLAGGSLALAHRAIARSARLA